MSSKAKMQKSTPGILPMEYLPRIEYAFDEKHTRQYLIPGKVFVASKPFAISTIVGSGVALCLWDSIRGLGGMNHFMLPEGPENNQNANRYASIANPALLQQMLDSGAEVKSLQAKIFGGSLPNVDLRMENDHLGDRNVQVAREFLKSNRIKIVQSEVGGNRGRKLIFHTDDGRTWSEQL